MAFAAWRKVRLGEAVTFRSGGTPSMAVRRYWDGDIPWLTAKDLKSFDLSTSQMMVTEEGARAGSRIAPAGSVLLLVRGMTLFKDVPMGVARRDVAFGQDLKALEPKEGLLGSFLGWKLLASKHLLMQMVDTAGHGTGRLSTERLAHLAISVPPEDEQLAIVELLAEMAAAVTSTEAVIKQKVVAKAAVAEELLTGRRRFPGFTAPWRERRLGTFFAPKDDRAPTQTPVILSCSKVYGIIPQSERFSKQLASVNNAHYKHILPGDLVYDPMLLWDASIAFSSYEGIVSPAYETLAWTGDEVGDRRFFKALFRTDPMKYIYKTISQGTNARRRKAPVSDFLRVSLRLPEVEEQRRIAEFLEMLDKEITLLRRQRDLLNEQKKGLMQKLLTGEVRLKEFRS